MEKKKHSEILRKTKIKYSSSETESFMSYHIMSESNLLRSLKMSRFREALKEQKRKKIIMISKLINLFFTTFFSDSISPIITGNLLDNRKNHYNFPKFKKLKNMLSCQG